MMDRLLLAVAGSLVVGTQAGFNGFLIRSKNGVIMQGYTKLLQSGRSPMQLLVKTPPEKMSCDNVPCFEATSDKAIKLKGKDKCIEAIGHKNGDAVRLNDCTGAKTQKWNWIPDGDGGNLIQIQDTNLCLKTKSDASFNGFSVQLHECQQTGGETWKFEVPAFSSKENFSFDLRHFAITLIALAGLGVVGLSTVLARQNAKAREFAQHRGDACIDERGVSLSARSAATEIAASTSGESCHAPTQARASDICMMVGFDGTVGVGSIGVGCIRRQVARIDGGRRQNSKMEMKPSNSIFDIDLQVPRLLEVWDEMEEATPAIYERMVRRQIQKSAEKCNVPASLARVFLYRHGRLPDLVGTDNKQARKDEKILMMLQGPFDFSDEGQSASLPTMAAALDMSDATLKKRLKDLGFSRHDLSEWPPCFPFHSEMSSTTHKEAEEAEKDDKDDRDESDDADKDDVKDEEQLEKKEEF